MGPHTGGYPEFERGATRGIILASAITFAKCRVHPLRRRTRLLSVLRLRTLPGKAQANQAHPLPGLAVQPLKARVPTLDHLSGGTLITAEPPAGDVVAERAQELGRGIPREQPGWDEVGMSAMARRCRDQWRGAPQRGEVESGPSQLQREQAG